MGAVAWAMRQRSVSHPPLIEPDVPISGIRLSDCSITGIAAYCARAASGHAAAAPPSSVMNSRRLN